MWCNARVTADPIFRVLTGYRTAAALRTAIELDWFSAIAEGRRTAMEISASRGGTERSCRIVLDAVAAAVPSVLRKTRSRYALTPLSRRYLVRTSPEWVGRLMGVYGHRAMWDAFHRLPEAVRAGSSVVERDAHDEEQPFWEDFARATARDAEARARSMLRLLKGKAPNPCRILDLACGSGIYGATFARWIPGARLTLLDRPNVLRVTRGLVDVPARMIEGDLFETPFGGPYDLVLASHVFHHFSPDECRRLLGKIAGALAPRGRLVIQEFIPDDARSRRVQPLLFAVTMLVWTRGGDAYTVRDYRSWLKAAGFGSVRHHSLPSPGDAILATKR